MSDDILLLTPQAVAETLKISVEQVYALARKKRIGHVMVESNVRFLPEDVYEYIGRNHVNVP